MTRFGDELLQAAREVRGIARGEITKGFNVHVPDTVDVKAVRKKLKMTQAQFAKTFGLGYDAVRDWEAGRRQPERTARILLTVIDRKPKAVREALAL